jgi:hypothetical protein
LGKDGGNQDINRVVFVICNATKPLGFPGADVFVEMKKKRRKNNGKIYWTVFQMTLFHQRPT